VAKDRRTHSTIDKLPGRLRDVLTRMLVDNEWPDDFPRDKAFGFKGKAAELTGRPRYEDLVTYCEHKGFKVSQSAIGRFGMRMRNLARMKSAGVIVRDVMKDLTAEKASATQKAVAEIITAQVIEFASENNLTAKEIQNIARAVKDCTHVSISADKYIREQLGKKVEAAAKSTKKKLTKAGVNSALIQEIIDEHLGVVKS
jgi:hypothetical protein